VRMHQMLLHHAPGVNPSATARGLRNYNFARLSY
jgi:hypothetical protein